MVKSALRWDTPDGKKDDDFDGVRDGNDEAIDDDTTTIVLPPLPPRLDAFRSARRWWWCKVARKVRDCMCVVLKKILFFFPIPIRFF